LHISLRLLCQVGGGELMETTNLSSVFDNSLRPTSDTTTVETWDISV